MKPLNFSLKLFFSFVLLAGIRNLNAQVKIGGNPKTDPHPSSVLELTSSDKGFLLPRMTTMQMQAIKEPADGLLIYNTEAKSIFVYNQPGEMWISLSSEMASKPDKGCCEWEYHAPSKQVRLVRGFTQGDSMYYNVGRKKFVFADRVFDPAGSSAADVAYPGKYIFKATASRIFHDAASENFPSITNSNFLFDVDNDSFAVANPKLVFYNGMRIATRLLSTATQKPSTIRSLLLQVNHTGSDSINAVTALASNAFVDGAGYTATFNGFQNYMNVTSSATGNIGTITGYRNLISMAPTAPGTVSGNVIGYLGTLSGFKDSTGSSKISTGRAYAIYLGSVEVAPASKNFAFYSHKGLNRFGDSVLITDGGYINPRAVLDINATSAMIIPSGNNAQRPTSGVVGMFRNNTEISAPEYFDGTGWKTFSTGGNEWVFDAGPNRVNLARGLTQGDSMYYNVGRKKFVFADRVFDPAGGSAADVAYPGKYIFKATASRIFHDAASENFPSITNSNFLFDVDNDSFAVANPKLVFYNGMRIATRLLSTATQKPSTIRSLLLQVNHTGSDSINAVTALASNAFVDGAGYTATFNGFQNYMNVTSSATGNIGTITGYRNLISMAPDAIGSVSGNVVGYMGTLSGFKDLSGNSKMITGRAYAIYLGSVEVAPASKNFAFYSHKGLNRFGDSVLITDGGYINPRAVLDVNATSAMIVPTGTTAQRPATGPHGMLRYNSENGGRLETFNGSSWSGIIKGAIGLDLPAIAAGSGHTTSFPISGATVGSVVAVSPDGTLPDGIIIAWVRVSGPDTVEIRFENNASVAVDPPSTGFSFRLIQ